MREFEHHLPDERSDSDRNSENIEINENHPAMTDALADQPQESKVSDPDKTAEDTDAEDKNPDSEDPEDMDFRSSGRIKPGFLDDQQIYRTEKIRKSGLKNAGGITGSIYQTTRILLFGEEDKKSRKNRKNKDKHEEEKKPKKKRRLPFRLTYKGKILLVILAGFLILGLFLIFNQPTPIDRLSLTYLDNLSKDSLQVDLQQTFADTYRISDSTIYGETLTLYGNRYQNGTTDELYGRNVMLRNIETGQQLTYTFAGGADSGIPLGELEPGVYEIYVYDGFTPKRVYMSDEYHSDPFTTMRRNKSVNTINLDASKDTLKKFGVETDENYLYLTVTSSLPKVKIVDVMIDPSGLVKYELSSMVDDGYVSATFNEPQQSYDFAQMIQMYLQEAGLRVEISRDRDEAISYYGVNSRIGKGYTKQAKVYLGLDMDVSDASLPFMMTSPYSNGLLANSISYALRQNGIELQQIINAPERLDEGVEYDTFSVSDNYEYLPYTQYPQLRESGGKVTYAGMAPGSENNGNFSQNPGMYGIEFFYASTDNPASQAYFEANREVMARSIAQGIIDYFQIPEVQENVTADPVQ